MFDFKVLEDNLPIILGFALIKSKTEKDEEIVQRIKEGFENLDLAEEPEVEDVIKAVLDILEETAKLTESELDNIIVSVAKSLAFRGVSGIFARFKARREQKRIERKLRKK